MTVSPIRLNHAVLFVADVDRSVDFYRRAFGMETIQEMPGRAAFLRLPRSGNHHDLGLFGVDPSTGPRRSGTVGLYHLAWQVDTIDDLAAIRDVLIDLGGYTGESSHGATKSLYGADPDGNEFEVMWMLPRDEWGQYDQQAVTERLDLEAEVARWSGIATATTTAGQGRSGA